MRDMSQDEQTLLEQIQKGLNMAESASAGLMKLAKASGDEALLSEAQTFFGKLHALHGEGGKTLQRLYGNSRVVIMGPGR